MGNFLVRQWKLIFFISLLFAGCGKKYNRTVKVCEGRLYVEIFNTNSPGVSAHYLTDTINFRLFVGKYDNEHENFSYRCEGDTLSILKIESASLPGGERKVSNIRKYSIAQLKKSKTFE
jgi:hypothetical protein